MPYSDPTALVSAAWLKERLGAPDIKLVDASWHMPATGRDGRKEYEERHIPGAAFFDIDEIADLESGLPHMLPKPEKFAARVRDLGIGDGATVVAYDSTGIFAAARVWWMFRVMGHERVAVLDGGLPAWIAAGGAISDDRTAVSPRHFTPRPRWSLLRRFDEMRRVVETGAERVVDARPAGRFAGTEPEPRPGLRGGHMPGAANLPYSELLAPDGTMKPAEELAAAFAKAGIDPREPAVATCGSGVSASVVLLALAVLGQRQAALYDGSWAEWGGRADTAVET